MLRELYRRLLDSLHIKGRDVTVFLLSLLLASSVWLLHNLSLNYSDLVSIPVTAQSNIEGHSAYSSNRSEQTTSVISFPFYNYIVI